MRLRDLQLSESRVPAPGWRKNGAHKKKKTGCASRRSSPLLTEESHAHHANRWYPRSQNAILACLHTKQDLLACRHIQPFSSLFFSLRYFSILTLPSSEVKWTYVNREKELPPFMGGKAHRPTPLWRSRSGKHIGGRAGNSRIGKTRAAYMP